VISVGVRGTAMPGFASTLTPQQRWNIINYIYSLRREKLVLPAARQDATAVRGDTASPVILALLDSALDFARNGKAAEAGDRAFDAYIAFEPLETPARAKKPGLVATMERHFADFKGAVKRNDIAGAKSSRDAIADGLPSVIDLTQQPSTSWEAFFQSFLIILREGFEAILVVGAVVAFLIKTGHRERLRSIWVGLTLGVFASLATAVVLKTLLGAMPASRSLVEGITMLIAVVVLFSVSYWLISKVEAAKWQKFIREKVTSALEHGGGKALILVAFLAVYREGAETALFYQALFNGGPNVGVPLALGLLAGGAALAVIFTLFYRYGVRIPMRPFFAVTSVLLYYMAFVFMGKGIRELQEANVMPITVVPGAPHIDAMGIYPSVETLTAQAILIALLAFATIKTFWPGHKHEGGAEA
jgi:high-affinity iron transporter